LLVATIGTVVLSGMGTMIGLGRLGGVGAAAGILVIFVGVVSLLGGVYGVQRKLWGLALAGAITSLFLGWLFVLGVLAITFVALSKKEFVS